MQEIALSIIVAMTQDGVIGDNGKLLWHLPSDLARFRKITMRAGTVVMGSKTYKSILDRNGGPLRGRKHIVLTRSGMFSPHESVRFVQSFGEACMVIVKYANHACIIGGGEIFRLFLPIPQVTNICVTTVHTSGKKLSGDATFPITDLALWQPTTNLNIRRRNPNDEYETSLTLYKRSQF